MTVKIGINSKFEKQEGRLVTNEDNECKPLISFIAKTKAVTVKPGISSTVKKQQEGR